MKTNFKNNHQKGENPMTKKKLTKKEIFVAGAKIDASNIYCHGLLEGRIWTPKPLRNSHLQESQHHKNS